MPKATVYDMTGKQVGEIELAEAVFGIEPNEVAMYEAVKNHLANCRQGTQSTLTRAEVRGGGRKPWRQKGTGRARHGSTRSAQYVGGGVIFGPKPRDYGYTVPKKIRRLALKSALSSKMMDKKIIVVDSFEMEAIKTAEVAKAIKALNVNSTALLVLDDNCANAVLSARNIPTVKTAGVNTINVFDILKYDSFLVTKAAVEKIQEVYV